MNNTSPLPIPSEIRLVAIDLDGTLLNSQKELPPDAIEVFKAAHRAGILISIITGRNICSVRELGRKLKISGPHASSGGAMVSGFSGRPVYARHPLNRDEVRTIVSISRQWNLAIFLHSSDRILCENADRYSNFLPVPYYPCTLQARDDVLDGLRYQTLKVTIYGDRFALLNTHQELKKYNSRFHVTTAGEEDLEITPSGINKGSALREISKVTGIPLQNIMTIGDSPNDLSMFREAGLAVAVGNAFPEVKQAAAIIAPSNDEGGVLWAIQNLALSSLPTQSV